MLVNLKEVLNYANQHNCAIGCFNATTLENIMAIVAQAELLNVPVILSHAQVHESVAPVRFLGPVMLTCAKLAKVPVCVHLDHCDDFAYLEHCIDLGFTSVMYDGSSLPFEQNVESTQKAVQYAHERNVDVEGEIGSLGGAESQAKADFAPDDLYTKPEQAKQFVELTHVDALACSFGTAHGIYLKAPKLQFDLISKIRDAINVPIVMHGGSGCSDDDYRQAINNGVRKINYYSYMAKAGADATRELLKDDKVIFYHDIALNAVKAMQENIAKAMIVFSNK